MPLRSYPAIAAAINAGAISAEAEQEDRQRMR
jgi:hypothetical protein